MKKTQSKRLVTLTLILGLFAGDFARPRGTVMKDLEWHRRVLIISAPSRQDPMWVAEDKAVAGWGGAEERDVTVVRIEGELVSGIGETATELRKRYHLSASAFSVTLIGKDGLVATSSPSILTGEQIGALIDAMPMRRAGQR
jgi:hypothetical protein